MDAAEFQEAAKRTLIFAPERPLTDEEHMFAWCALGLAGEAAEALETATVPEQAAGLARTAGAVCELAKKQVFYGQGIKLPAVERALAAVLVEAGKLWGIQRTPSMEEEIGDLLWYAASLCTLLNIPFADITPVGMEQPMAANVRKLLARLPNGWSAADATARKDKKER